jgi:signal transduction histidine kinase/BarA-like signal transduction histidine kinase
MENSPVKVLLIEDDKDDYILVRKLLSGITTVSYDLQWAPTYGAALEAMGKDHHDVYLLDYQLGDRTGLDLLHEMNGKGSTVPVIFLTGHGDYGVDIEVMRAGASDYLVKGQISPDLLERSIRYAVERRRLEHQLRQSQKMEAIGTLAGGIAHDFNNVLAAIIGFSEMAAEWIPADSKAQHSLKRILEAGIRGRNLIKQILTFSRQSEQRKEPLQLSLVVEETLRFLRASLPSTIDISFNVASQPGLVLADVGQIQQVVLNLCTNAAHAMKEKGGAIAIDLSDFGFFTPGEAPHSLLEPGSYLKLSVSDTGDGIAGDIIDRIFDPFFTTKKPGEGTGLGLSVVLGIVESHGGAITVRSEPGKGSVFAVYLPRVVEARAEAPDGNEEAPTGTERILFIDDEEAIAEMGEALLAGLGYEVITKTGSNDALELLKADPHRFDLVITDQTMPEMTGLELAKEILAIKADMPVIMCTGFSYLVDADKARAAGIKAFAMKPLTKREIAKTIRKVLDVKA